MGGGSVNEVKVDKVQEIQRFMKDLNGLYFPVIKAGKKYLKKSISFWLYWGWLNGNSFNGISSKPCAGTRKITEWDRMGRV